MKTPHGYCDLRVERVNDDIINAYIERKLQFVFYSAQKEAMI